MDFIPAADDHIPHQPCISDCLAFSLDFPFFFSTIQSKLDTAVSAVKSNEERRLEYMTLAMHDMEIREEALEEGLEKAREEGREEYALMLREE